MPVIIQTAAQPDERHAGEDEDQAQPQRLGVREEPHTYLQRGSDHHGIRDSSQSRFLAQGNPQSQDDDADHECRAADGQWCVNGDPFGQYRPRSVSEFRDYKQRFSRPEQPEPEQQDEQSAWRCNPAAV
jgi:hypothetical protein